MAQSETDVTRTKVFGFALRHVGAVTSFVHKPRPSWSGQFNFPSSPSPHRQVHHHLRPSHLPSRPSSPIHHLIHTRYEKNSKRRGNKRRWRRAKFCSQEELKRRDRGKGTYRICAVDAFGLFAKGELFLAAEHLVDALAIENCYFGSVSLQLFEQYSATLNRRNIKFVITTFSF